MIDRKLDRFFDVMAAIDGGAAGELDTPRHRELAERIAIEGSVLLCNDGGLPLEDSARIALIGPNADTPKVGGVVPPK